AETLYLTVTFDTQALDHVPAFWARLLGCTPEYLRVAITALLFALLVSGPALLRGLRHATDDAVRIRVRILVVHLCALALFAWITGIVIGQHFQATSHQGAWALAWVFAGGATIASWGLS